MQIGLLWYDRDVKKPVVTKIDEAAERYREKFGAAPDTCHVNPRDIAPHRALRIVANPLIQPNYVWIGQDDEVSALATGHEAVATDAAGAEPDAVEPVASKATRVTRPARSARAAGRPAPARQAVGAGTAAVEPVPARSQADDIATPAPDAAPTTRQRPARAARTKAAELATTTELATTVEAPPLLNEAKPKPRHRSGSPVKPAPSAAVNAAAPAAVTTGQAPARSRSQPATARAAAVPEPTGRAGRTTARAVMAEPAPTETPAAAAVRRTARGKPPAGSAEQAPLPLIPPAPTTRPRGARGAKPAAVAAASERAAIGKTADSRSNSKVIRSA